MGRGDLSRKLLIVAALAAAAASSAAAAVGVHWTLLASGAAEQSAGSQPVGYVAVTRTQESRFLQRLAPADQSKIAHVDLARTGVVAVFLDGIPCSRDITVDSVARSRTTVTVVLHWRRPPVGMGMCVNLGTPYVVLGVPRAALGKPAPQHVRVMAIARA